MSCSVRPLLAQLLKHRIGPSSSSEFIGLDRCYSARSRRCFWTLASDNFDRSINDNNNNNCNRSGTTWCRLKKVCLGLALAAGTLATCGTVVLRVLGSPVVEAGNASVHPPKLPWGFNGAFASLDHSSVRRGWQVYKSVCSACHSLRYVAFKDLVDVCYTEDEVRDMCSEYEVKDGPNEEGEYFMRPAKLSDKVPGPYENEEAARFANNAALPVDLSFVVNARHHGPDYVFGLLTGYREPPAGVELMEGQAFNPYFEGGALGMMEMLQDGGVDYDDGTPATKSQMAKDVVEFLNWTANQEWNTRKLYAMKTIGVSLVMAASLWLAYRHKINVHKKTVFCLQPKPRRNRPCDCERS
ncbi:hypothetical protein TKK_0018537 [Trichogramma kaykai]|uniref:Cytochrome c domain-containing protein n=1 Tax=Trichogramma kaykai TaxID=54128 RepID=A0ABD2VYX2_9HYME